MAIKRRDLLIVKQQGREIPAEAASDESDGSVQVKIKGTFSTVNVHDVQVVATAAGQGKGPTKGNPLEDLLENVKKDKDGGKYDPLLDPKDYGFDDEDEMWRWMRRAAGLPDNPPQQPPGQQPPKKP